MNWLHQKIDEVFIRMKKEEFAMTVEDYHFPKEMIESEDPKNKSLKVWKPTPSTITDEELDELESKISKKLPKSYREFLKYKFFNEFMLEDYSIVFPSNLPNKAIPKLFEKTELFDGDLDSRGYIYFADFNDGGFLCFDTNQEREDNEYPVVMIDHEDTETPHLYAENFRDLLASDADRSNRFIEYLNEFDRKRWAKE
ncbi:SMI1/KNR4 family protein [Bernardetia sp.]|uniref:SMI1/KNR4 family protein n=1 Tax=Bernardetia sp. TaxID=1937974 RepID=UPI0025C367C0|nr:SMI1/KNR4 family protein [Bernardetia sp.]